MKKLKEKEKKYKNFKNIFCSKDLKKSFMSATMIKSKFEKK